MKRFAAILIMLAAALAAEAKQYTLFDKNGSDYVIVIDDNATPAVRLAANELSTWLAQVSGTVIPVKGLDAGRKGKRLVVGLNDIVKKSEFDPYLKEDDAFCWYSRGGDILLWGGSDRGTLYAVYSFLEENFGCRWYTNTISVAPKMAKWTFKDLSHYERTDIRVRNDFWLDAFDPLWAVRNRSNGSMDKPLDPKYGGSESFWGAHTFDLFVPARVYFDSHPEYYSLINGKRTHDHAQLCLSNPDVLKLVTEGLLETMRRNPNALIYNVGQNDELNPCECEKCRAIKERYGNEESGVMIWFVNQVADAVKEEFPDKFVGTFAYQYTRTAPKNIKPRDNVVVRLCSIEECQLHKMDECEKNREFLKDIKDWAAIAPHLYIWDYVATFTQYLAPMANIQTYQDRFQLFRDCNAIGIMPQGNYQSKGSILDDLKAYVIAKLLWNPDCDVDAVVDDFVNGVFGPAAPVIKEYLAFEKKCLVRPDVHETCFPNAMSPIYTDEFITEGRKLLQKAYKAVEGDDVLTARVESVEMPLCYLQLARNPREGFEAGAMDLFNRVVDRDGITLASEWGGYGTVESFRNAMEVGRHITIDPRECGDIGISGPGKFFHFNKVALADVTPDSPYFVLDGAILMSTYFGGWNGKTQLYLYVAPEAGGNAFGCYKCSGNIVPGEEYEASMDFGWNRGDVILSGLDRSKDYSIVVTAINPEKMKFKIVPVEF